MRLRPQDGSPNRLLRNFAGCDLADASARSTSEVSSDRNAYAAVGQALRLSVPGLGESLLCHLLSRRHIQAQVSTRARLHRTCSSKQLGELWFPHASWIPPSPWQRAFLWLRVKRFVRRRTAPAVPTPREC